jgi:hypothetical protein
MNFGREPSGVKKKKDILMYKISVSVIGNPAIFT